MACTTDPGNKSHDDRRLPIISQSVALFDTAREDIVSDQGMVGKHAGNVLELECAAKKKGLETASDTAHHVVVFTAAVAPRQRYRTSFPSGLAVLAKNDQW